MTGVLKALDAGGGEALWAAGSLMVVKATTEDTLGGLTVIEQESPPGLNSPEHIHDAEEQCIYVLSGSLDIQCSGVRHLLSAGGFAVFPRGVPHSFIVGSEGARFLNLTTPAGFETFARAIGVPAADLLTPPDAAASLDLAMERVESGHSGDVGGRPATT